MKTSLSVMGAALCALSLWACIELPGALPEGRFDGGIDGFSSGGGGRGGSGGRDGTPDAGPDAAEADAGPMPEQCNGLDDDLDDSIDEGVRNACGSCGPVADEVCDGYDNDCDLLIDEAPECACEPGFEEPCGADVGACTAGMRTCSPDGQWGPCSGLSPQSEQCNDLDDDCDGDTDEDVQNPCGGCGPLPAEVCNGEDDDCDGVVDGREVAGDACDCPPGEVEACGSDVGACTIGERLCRFDGWGGCNGAVEPTTERCNQVDDDCDGVTDEDACDCDDGATRPCGSDVGRCRMGSETCADGVWGPCAGEQRPQDELCNAQDDDCDGATDEDACDCEVGDERPCGSAVGACHEGTQTCAAGGWGGCQGSAEPRAEQCDGLDDDCDGATDENWPSLGEPCAVGVGACRAQGQQVCQGAGTACSAQPGAARNELCNGVDDDCDGSTDEGAQVGPCDTGEPGQCSAGRQRCVGGQLVCDRLEGPRGEGCDGVDEDCDGRLDEGTGGGACDTGEPGRCAQGTEACQAGGLTCRRNRDPIAESCNGVDQDCDGTVDEGTDGAACDTGEPGRCAQGTQRCQGGTLSCVRQSGPAAESCNGIDDDCDGNTDEPPVLLEAQCDTRQPGICAEGVPACIGGAVVCQAPAPRAEQCNGVDDDCDGNTDERLGGDACDTGLEGVCADGRNACVGGAMRCEIITPDRPEGEIDISTCNGLDDDCDGSVDEGHPRLRQCTLGISDYFCAGGEVMLCENPGPEPIPR